MNSPKEKPDKEKAEEKPEKKSGKVDIKTQSRGKIYDSIFETIGGTPLVRLPGIKEKYSLEADILAKLEFFNPVASVKDRNVLAMFEEAESAGKITPGKTVLLEPTSGNTGVSLALMASVKGYRLILTMPESVPFERRKILSYYGAEIFLTRADRGMKGAIEKAEELIAESKEEVFMFNQFDNPSGIQVHAQTTAREIWDDTAGKIDILVAGVGTGATITGLSQALRKEKEDLKVYAVEPEESPVLSEGEPTQHKIEGIGVGFVPEILDMKFVDGVIRIASNRALEVTREAAKLDGVPCGISSGAALAAAIDLAKIPENKGKMIVAIFPSFVERYISTPLFDNLGN